MHHSVFILMWIDCWYDGGTLSFVGILVGEFFIFERYSC